MYTVLTGGESWRVEADEEAPRIGVAIAAFIQRPPEAPGLIVEVRKDGEPEEDVSYCDTMKALERAGYTVGES